MHIAQDEPNSQSSIHLSAVTAKKQEVNIWPQTYPKFMLQNSIWRALEMKVMKLAQERLQIFQSWQWKRMYERGSLCPKLYPSGQINAKGSISDLELTQVIFRQ